MRSFYVFILLFSSFTFFSQKSITEKEYEELQRKARLHINGSIDSSFYYANKIELSNDNIHKAFAKSIKSYLYQLKGDTINSNLSFSDADNILNKAPTSKRKTKTSAFLYLYKGLTNWKRNKYSESILNYEKAKKYSNSIGDILQVINLDNNIALVQGEMGNFVSAISSAKHSDVQLDKLKLNLTFDDFKSKKSNIYINLGFLYNKLLYIDNSKKYSDSAVYFFNKSLLYSDKLVDNKLTAELNLAGLYFNTGQFDKAESLYFSIYKFAKDNDLQTRFLNASFHLGKFYFKKNELNKALIYFKKVDSLHSKNSFDDNEFIYSKYYQSLIYDKQKQPDNAIDNAELFIVKYENKKENEFSELNKINLYLGSKDVLTEIQIIKKRNKTIKTTLIVISVLVIIFFFTLFCFLLKIRKDKKIANIKINELKIEFSNRNEKIIVAKNYISLSIDNEKELNILNALEKLEEKKYFLSIDFNQQNVAKKIKTNTTYLSHVVNKNFQKSFSEYSNELKINYVIEELINNAKYRKYSTQAIAESVGFKNANSFTKSFKKRTGVTPVQFINKI